jgi:hypothetical protein
LLILSRRISLREVNDGLSIWQYTVFALKGGRTGIGKCHDETGKLQRILLQVTKDTNGLASDWKLNQIEVKTPSASPPVLFRCNCWFSEQAGLQHTLFPEGSEASERQAVVEYKVETVTSDRKGAGTDAEVMVEIEGHRGRVGWQRLRTYSRDALERNKRDSFIISGADIGEVTKVLSSFLKFECGTGSGSGAGS